MSPPLTSHSSAPADRDTVGAADLAALQRRDRTDRRTRAAFATVFALIGAALAGPVLVTIPARALAVVALVALAVVGAGGLASIATGWLAGRYEMSRPHPWQVWQWRITRRWYAPGATVWHTEPNAGASPLAVLAWYTDPACQIPWALIYDGTPLMSGGSAVWLPLTALTPTPPRPASMSERIGGPR
ncbi:hypothetical protein [Actinomadura rudentiformis]|uniref:Uncharacterized protein n=1 Tax=Actinomadura rudentiformis TaxID=359158 RepID=A0A6H9YQ42_9ACTN|nr:hypothetical protein [Actinomadura rudentiformis]KAB2347248.1 hypothetical protein F8566_19690 [Actinomadura rudentiformis]